MEAVRTRTGRTPTADFEPLAIPDQMAVLRHDVQTVVDSPLIADGTVVAGLIYDLRSGWLTTIVEPHAG